MTLGKERWECHVGYQWTTCLPRTTRLMDPLSTLTPRILQGRVTSEEEVPERRLLEWSFPPNTVPCFFCSTPSQIPLLPPGAKQPPFRQKLDGGELSGGQSLLSQVLLFHSKSDRSRAERAAKRIQFYFMHIFDFVHPLLSILTSPNYQLLDDDSLTCWLLLSVFNSVSTQQPEEPLYL